jgi:subtilisin family serine protease
VNLAESRKLVKADLAAAAGYKGAGTFVAVLDTGVDYTRAAFGSCTAPNSPSTCKVFFAKDYAPEDYSRDPVGHGTHVAGITVGIAPGTRIFALDVFDGDTYEDRWVLQALDDVEYWRGQGYNIRAVNMSIGTTTFFGDNCTTVFGVTNPYTATFGDLRAVGVLPVVASGNDADAYTGTFTAGIAYPACTPGAVNVGAVYDANVGAKDYSPGCIDHSTWADKPVCWSQAAAGLSILAPGAIITAAGITASGTSMATPHVAGAAAVLAAAKPSATTTQIESALVNSGPSITDTRFSPAVTTRRLDVMAALAALGVGSDTTAPTMTTPTHHPIGKITSVVPTRVLWKATDVSGIAAYEVWLRQNGGAWQQVTLSSPTATSVTLNLTPGTKYEFGVRAKDTVGNWSGFAYDAPSVIDDRSTSISYTTGWSRQSWSSAYAGTVTASNTTSAYARHSFTGSAIGYVASFGNNRGQAKIYVDGVLKKTVDLYAATGKGATVAYSIRWNKAGSHTIDVQVVGTSGRPTIDVDAFVILR